MCVRRRRRPRPAGTRAWKTYSPVTTGANRSELSPGASRCKGRGDGRDSEDAPTVHLSGGAAGRAVTPHCPGSVGALRPRRRTRSRRTERRGSRPCNSRLRPPPTTAAPGAGPHHASGRVWSRPGPRSRSSLCDRRHVSTVTDRGSPAARRAPLRPPAPTRASRGHPARAGRLCDGLPKIVALVRVRGTAQSHRPLLRDGLRRPRGTRRRPRPGVPRSLDCDGQQTCLPPTPR